MLSLVCSSRSSCRICAWIVTSSAVVGSSAISSAGPADQRHGDHGALAHARPTARTDTCRRRGCGFGKADQPEHLLGLVRAARLARIGCGSAATSLIWLPIVCSGDSEVIGSWKILPMRLPRSARISAPSRGSRRDRSVVLPSAGSVNRMRPRHVRGPRQDAHDRLADDRLAGAGFADQRRDLAGEHAQIGLPHRVDRAAKHGKRDAEVLDPQQIGA